MEYSNKYGYLVIAHKSSLLFYKNSEIKSILPPKEPISFVENAEISMIRLSGKEDYIGVAYGKDLRI